MVTIESRKVLTYDRSTGAKGKAGSDYNSTIRPNYFVYFESQDSAREQGTHSTGLGIESAGRQEPCRLNGRRNNSLGSASELHVV